MAKAEHKPWPMRCHTATTTCFIAWRERLGVIVTSGQVLVYWFQSIYHNNNLVYLCFYWLIDEKIRMVAFAGLIYDERMFDLSLMLEMNLLHHYVSSQVSFFTVLLPSLFICCYYDFQFTHYISIRIFLLIVVLTVNDYYERISDFVENFLSACARKVSIKCFRK